METTDEDAKNKMADGFDSDLTSYRSDFSDAVPFPLSAFRFLVGPKFLIIINGVVKRRISSLFHPEGKASYYFRAPTLECIRKRVVGRCVCGRGREMANGVRGAITVTTEPAQEIVIHET